MAENTSNQQNDQATNDYQESNLKDQSGTKQETNSNQQVNNGKIGRLESQPGNMSGVDIESQRTKTDGQDLASRGSGQENTA